MKIKEVIKNGRAMFRVNDPHGPGRKRQRRFFRTRQEADAYIRRRRATVREFGIHFATFTPAQQAELATQLERLQRLGWTLGRAVEFIEAHGKTPPAARLETVARAFLLAKQAAACRPRYLRTLRASLERFLAGRREKPIAEVTAHEIREYITRNGWTPAAPQADSSPSATSPTSSTVCAAWPESWTAGRMTPCAIPSPATTWPGTATSWKPPP